MGKAARPPQPLDQAPVVFTAPGKVISKNRVLRCASGAAGRRWTERSSRGRWKGWVRCG